MTPTVKLRFVWRDGPLENNGNVVSKKAVRVLQQWWQAELTGEWRDVPLEPAAVPAPPKKEWGGVMTDKQPEALRLADEADHRDFGLDPEPTWIKNAAAELRRLHEENETLRSKLIEPKLEQENDMKKYFASPNPWKLML